MVLTFRNQVGRRARRSAWDRALSGGLTGPRGVGVSVRLPSKEVQPLIMAGFPRALLGSFPPGSTLPDPLSDALECLALNCWLPGRWELGAPWGIRVVTHLGWFYLVMENRCTVQILDDDVALSLTAGDLLIVFQGKGHCLRDTAGTPTTPIQQLLKPCHFERCQSLVHGGEGMLTRVFCGCFLLDGVETSPLHGLLPAVIHVEGERQQALPYVDHILRLLDLEATNQEPCARIVMNRLVRILLLKAIQRYTMQLPEGNASRLKCLSDPDIGRALSLMHAQPDAPWTVASLAEHVAMARSTFAARFTELVGRPPLEYLTLWRIQKASFLLRTTGAELKEVAARVGYESTSAFSKAFTRWTGTAPGIYRRAAPLPRPDMPPL